jgi:phosphoenolpyruvate-protein kinase (PTS system EI component)
VTTGKEVNVCGEMASDPVSAILLLGMGINVLSMEPRHLLRIKEVLVTIRKDDAVRAARKALSMKTAGQVEEFIMREFGLRREE